MEPVHFVAHLDSGLIMVENDSTGFIDIPQDHLSIFQVDCDGMVFGVRLSDGAIMIGEELYLPSPIPTTPLRLIYYKTMQSEAPTYHVATLHSVTIGWQTTITDEDPYRNVRFGIKVYPNEQRWEVSEDV